MIGFFVRHPTATTMLMLAFIVLGIKALPELKRETFPEFSKSYITAQVVLPGASPQDVEENLCLRMEDAVDSLGSIIETKCDALEGVARMTLKLDDKADLSRSLVDVQTKISAIKDFPAEIEPPIVEELDFNERIIDIAVSASTSKPELKAYAEDLKRRLKLDTSISQVEISGFSSHQLLVEISLGAIKRLGMSVADVAKQIEQQNVQLPSGTVETPSKNILIRFDQREVEPERLANIVIRSDAQGGVVRLRDIATITDRFELDEESIRFDGEQAAILTVFKNKSQDSLRLKEEIIGFLDAEKLRTPNGITISTSNDLSSLLWDRLTMLIKNGWQGVVLVFLCMWLFFSLRYSFWVAMGLPIAFMGSLFFMAQVGLTINIMTLVAFLMAIGIMMDDAIVIAESIAAHIERGMSKADAVIQGVKRVLPGVVSSFLTTVFIFSSIAFMEGDMGKVLRVVPQTLLLILTISLVEAFLILPNHLAHSAKGKERKTSRFKQIFNQKFEHFRTVQLVAAVEWVINWRYVFMGSVISLLFISISLVAGGAIKFVGFPELDGDVAEARIILPPGSTLLQTEHVVNRIVSVAKALDDKYSQKEDGQRLIQHITERFNFNADAGESGAHVATVKIDLLSAEVRQTLMSTFIREWQQGVGEMVDPIAIVYKQPKMGPAGRAIEIRVRGDDLDELKSASIEVQQYLQGFNGVSGVMDSMRPGKAEILMTLKPGAEAFGVNGMMLASQLRGAYFHQTADNIQVGPESIQIDVQLDKTDAAKLENLANFPITIGSAGEQVPLSAVADFEWQRGYVKISRLDGMRFVTITGEVDTHLANASEINNAFKAELLPELKKRYPGIRVSYEGEVKESKTTQNSMASGFIVGLLAVFAILSLQFKSYIEPLVVMAVIPLGLIGVLWGHLLLGYSMSMPSIMGFVALAGVVVNDSILLVQYIRYHVEEGQSVHQAVVSASKERFRAVFITSLTTAAGMLPLLLETSIQAQVLQPLVVSMVFGIFASTALVLFMVPACYAILEDFGKVSFSQKAEAIAASG
ncbi:efflux RND transporter permease subunit [Shewanella sp. MBTL60-007]|uniref:efflux RND transporter permease subunit n=1 Tax=Shewanella sp. MBTL60-007 TaxID=2815911 RepID=UPI001BC38D70|nr:efflux RND transporter permease subunit [Shewanella sp. MBTL60-007]GIU15382.1 acriflavin resistance protein [Shewanella sp. MBTL60-007]